MKVTFLTVALLASLLVAEPAHGDDHQDTGKALSFKHNCMTCHGQNGISNADRYPNIGGQNEAYLVSRLRYFREAVEPGNQMNAQAAPLSDEEIDKLARYLSRQSG